MKEIPQFTRFEETVELKKHLPVPADWFLFIADVRGSTKLILEGRYKEVNYVGASCIAAAVNAIRPRPAFYVFGGDGATFLADPHDAPALIEALIAARNEAQRIFGMEVRVGMVPVRDLYAAGTDLRIGIHRIDHHFSQTVISGSALTLGEFWIKNPPEGKNYLLPERSPKLPGDFSGLECRWQPVKSGRGVITTILVQSLSSNLTHAEADYREFLAYAGKFLGDSVPITPGNLKLTVTPAVYHRETRLTKATQSKAKKALGLAKIYSGTMLFDLLWKSSKKADGDQYKMELIKHSDHRKFDGMLRMVLDLNYNQLEGLKRHLADRFKRDQLCYGMHTARSALVTCLVVSRGDGNHIHFVDGNDGGYAFAAKGFKQRLKERTERVGTPSLKKRVAI